MSCSCPPVVVTTEGVPDSAKICGTQANSLFQCNMCAKYYNNELKVIYDNTKLDDTSCYHCYYWIHYDVSNRLTMDGLYGLSIFDYIISCKDQHNPESCTRLNSCFLCDYLNNKPITNIKDEAQLNDIRNGLHIKFDFIDKINNVVTEFDI